MTAPEAAGSLEMERVDEPVQLLLKILEQLGFKPNIE
jgi:hypothetical protein